MSPVIQRTLAAIAAIVILGTFTAVAQSPGRWLTQHPPRLFVTDAYVRAQLRPNRRKSIAHLVAKLDQLQLHGGYARRQDFQRLHFSLQNLDAFDN